MIQIKDLLNRFNNILFSEQAKKETIMNVIKGVINIEIKSEEISFRNRTLFLNIKPLYKNEIFLKKEIILEELKKILGEKAPIDIF